jgi:hypothetical protein
VPILHYALVCRAILAEADDRGTTVDEVQRHDLLRHLRRHDVPSSVVLATAKRMLRTDQLVDDAGRPNSDAREWLRSGETLPKLLPSPSG